MNTYAIINEALETHDYRKVTLPDVRTALYNGWIDVDTAEMIAGIILDC